MKFKIDYKTSWGEHVAIRTNLQKETIPLCCEEDGHTWSQDIDLPPGTVSLLYNERIGHSSHGRNVFAT